MNAIRSALEHDLQQDLAARGGLAGFQAHALANLELRTIVRVSASIAPA